MAEMTNVSDITLKVKISMGPGQRPMITTVEPGQTKDFPDGYCETVKGPGPERLPCILSRSNSHNGVPALVPAAEAEAGRERYLRTTAAKAGREGDPQAVIRRLEAEVAAHKVQAAKPPASKATAAPPADDGDDDLGDEDDALADATTPKPRKSRAKAKA